MSPVFVLIVGALFCARTVGGEGTAPRNPSRETSIREASLEASANQLFPLTSASLTSEPPNTEHFPPAAAPRRLRPRDFLVNVDESQLKSFTDGRPLSSGNEVLRRILYCLPRVGPGEMERLETKGVTWRELAADPAAHRIEVFHLRGRVKEAVRETLEPQWASLLEYDHYYLVRFQLEGAPLPALVWARRIPSAWRVGEPMDQKAGAYGLFLQVGEREGKHAELVFAADRVAWLPDRVQEECGVDAGQALLGQLGMDLGLLDDVRRRNRKPIGASERECFYQLLAAVGGADRGQLERLAQRDLELPRLLQDPASRQGRLVLVQAAARRVTEILVGDRDLRERFGLERYYQIDGFVPLGEQVVRLGGQEGGRGGPVFANHFPATFCVRRLPPEMARLVDAASRNGSDLNESIQVAGYFFKLWAHQSEYVSSFDKEELQLSPLFIGLEPQLSLTKRWHSPRTAMACGLAFVAALAAIWYGVWRFGRSDRGFLRAAWKQRARRQRAESDGGPDVEAEDRPDLRRLE